MRTISAFTFIHNALTSGYPIVEAIQAVRPYAAEIVVVDMQSTDGTREILDRLHQHGQYECLVKILNGYWGNQAGETLRQAHNLYKRCSGDIILHFEADEVYDDKLIQRMIGYIHSGTDDIAVYRLQLEQNFQRCRWYPEPVHRVWHKDSNTRKEGHTTNRHNEAFVLSPDAGYLWDITNCFRDNWFNRVNKQAELRGEDPSYLMVGEHCNWDTDVSKNDAEHWLKFGRHWKWTNTPFDIPEILKPLVGMVKYEPKV